MDWRVVRAGLVGQTGLFPGDRRLRELDLLGDGLPLLNRLTPWERVGVLNFWFLGRVFDQVRP